MKTICSVGGCLKKISKTQTYTEEVTVPNLLLTMSQRCRVLREDCRAHAQLANNVRNRVKSLSQTVITRIGRDWAVFFLMCK